VPPGLAGLPWEALPSPDGRGPLALHPLVSLYRKTDAAAGRVLPGPLRIVVAIAAPDTGGAVLDYERELPNVLTAVRSARQDAADVRVVPFATCAAIRAELDRRPAHVLHISGHGSPGTLNLEEEDSSARLVTADELTDQAIPPGKMPPVITLSACYTDAAASGDGTSFAARLCQRGAAAVIATETSITDTYATRLLARLYGTLAQTSDPDVVGALAEARRQVQAELETSRDRRDNELAGLGEWAAVTVLAASGAVPVLDPGRTAPTVRQPSRPRIAGLAGREDWYFVGRRPEQRRWPAELTGSELPGIVICGIGGTGKTTLAAEITARIRDREPGRILVSLTGPLTLETLLGAVITILRRELLIQDQDGAAIRALDVAARGEVGWQDRLAILRGHVLDHVPVLLLLDNFEDNLRPDGDVGYVVGDGVLAGLLAAWVADPGRSQLLVTCRYRFALPGGAEQSLSFRQLGALSRAETMKLAWSLPALDRLDEGQLEQVWRLAGGHPRSLEYLDALLSGGQARYLDVTERLTAAITRRLSGADRGQWLAARTGLEAALAETVALAADDVLLDDLLTRLARVPGAVDLLRGVLVYREPVHRNAVLFQAGQPDPDAEHIPDRAAASEQITGILDAAGITVDESFDLGSLPGHIRAQLAPHIAELNQRPVPPFRPVRGLPEQIAACQAAGLLTISEAGQQSWFFVHRWTATELAGRAAREPGQPLAKVHRQAARYWWWRVRVWPQDRAADVHDLLEARHHLLQAGNTEDAGQVTEEACDQLHTWGAWDQEASLMYDTLARLPTDSPRRAAWIHQLGILAQDRGDYDEAARQYQRALDISERLGNQASIATSFSQLGDLEVERGGSLAAAVTWHVRALVIRLRLGVPQARNNLRRLAAYRRELGTEPFTGLLTQAADGTDLAETITSLLGQLGKTDDSTA
jgi:tetratricopeptide (TPR) repeat protein